MAGITIFEVSPRDGLQNLRHVVPTEHKIELVRLLTEAGLNNIEVASFVHPGRVPTMADAEDVFDGVKGMDGTFSVLVPNQRGIDRARAVGATKFNIFFSPNEAFNKENYGISLDQILKGYNAALEGVPTSDVRVYISMAFGGCVEELANAVQSGLKYGDKIVLCDTNGTANPFDIALGIDVANDYTTNLALHLHQGKHLLTNVETAYLHGVREFDASVGGLGGCPFVVGSGANLATEDLVAWCKKMGIPCVVDDKGLEKAVQYAKKLKNPTLKHTIVNKVSETKNRIKSKVVWF